MRPPARTRLTLNFLSGLLLLSLPFSPPALALPAGVEAVPGCDPEPGPLAAVGAAAEAAIDQEAGEAHVAWRVHSVCRQGDWAFAYVKGYLLPAETPLPMPSHVALARRLADGWAAVLPESAARYNAWLAQTPETLLPGSLKSVLRQPQLSAGLKPQAAYTGYSLPYPAGQGAYVIKHWYPAIDFSVSAVAPPGRIRNAKGGTVAFVKDSSSRQCGDPPPDYVCWQWANVVVLRTGPGEYAWYLHLAQNSVPDWIQEGVYVPAGADLGDEGATGWASGPHLHFMVSSTYSCCTGEGDSRFPDWPYTTTSRVDFSEYTWYNLPWIAYSQNGEASTGDGPVLPDPPPTAEPTAEPPPAQPPPATRPEPVGGLGCPNPYTVQPGEWLLRIASACGVTVNQIVAVNPGLNPNFIRAGQQINMPPSTAGPLPPAPAPTDPPPAQVPLAPPVPAAASACAGSHVVAAGENLFRLAYTCGLSTYQLAVHNGIPYPYTIYVGQAIRYP